MQRESDIRARGNLYNLTDAQTRPRRINPLADRLRSEFDWTAEINADSQAAMGRVLPSGQPMATALPTWGQPRNGSMEMRTGEAEGFAPPPLPPITGGLYSYDDAQRADEFGGVPTSTAGRFAGDGSAPPPVPPPLAGRIPPALAAQQAGLAPALPTNTDQLGDPNRVHVGEPTAGLSPLGKALAKHRVLKDATLSGGVEQTPWGMEETPPPNSKGPSRRKQSLIGLLQGLVIAANATKGDLAGTLAGGATGAIAGGVSPKLMQSFTRKQELDRQAGDIAQQTELELGAARVEETQAQTAQRRAEPALRAAELKRQGDLDTERRTDREADNTRADKVFEEHQRHNKEIEKGKPGTATEEIEVGGRKFNVSPSTAARILESRATAGSKPDPKQEAAREAAIEVELEGEAAADHLGKRKSADEQASKLRTDRENVVNQPISTAFTKEEKAKKIADYDRQIAEAEKESTYRQKEADDSFARQRKADAKARAAGGSKSGRTIEGAIEAFKASHGGKAPSAKQIANMRAALEN